MHILMMISGDPLYIGQTQSFPKQLDMQRDCAGFLKLLDNVQASLQAWEAVIHISLNQTEGRVDLHFPYQLKQKQKASFKQWC